VLHALPGLAALEQVAFIAERLQIQTSLGRLGAMAAQAMLLQELNGNLEAGRGFRIGRRGA
jgi:hypothetical protein